MTTKLRMKYYVANQDHENWPVGGFSFSETDHEGRPGFYCFIRMNDSMCILPVVRGAKTDHAWGWDGNIEKPTLKPSVLHQPSPTTLPWHGFVIQGELVTA